MKILIALILSCMTYAEVISPEQIIIIRDENTGIKEYEYNIAQDTYSLDLSYSMNANPMKAGDLSGIRAQITRHEKELSWIGYYAKTDAFIGDTIHITGNFDSDTTLINYSEIGIGLSRRSNLIHDFYFNKEIYDEISFAISKTTATTVELNNSLSGFGLVSGYGVFWRASRRVHLGARFNYHLLSLEDESDPNAIIEHSANWVSLDASFGFYF